MDPTDPDSDPDPQHWLADNNFEKIILLPNPIIQSAEKDIAGHLLVFLPDDVAPLVPEVALQRRSPALRQQLPWLP